MTISTPLQQLSKLVQNLFSSRRREGEGRVGNTAKKVNQSTDDAVDGSFVSVGGEPLPSVGLRTRTRAKVNVRPRHLVQVSRQTERESKRKTERKNHKRYQKKQQKSERDNDKFNAIKHKK